MRRPMGSCASSMPMVVEEKKADEEVPSIQLSAPKVAALNSLDTLKQRQSDMFDRACNNKSTTSSLPKPSSLVKQTFAKEVPSEVVTPVEILKSFSSINNGTFTL